MKFGFRQSIKNGHVLGNNRLWGYDKKDCKLTIIPEQAEAVRLIFELYATGKYGIRQISHELTRRGHTSLLGNEFNQLTIRHILTNPKYKGWYCGNKTQLLDYRTKKKAFLDESEWVMYPNPNIPAIVSEELWDQANAIFKQRSREVRTKSTSYHNRYPYSGKIICGRHGTSFHRQSFKTQKGETEFWRCKTYRQKGKDGCDLPGIRTHEVDQVLADLFKKYYTPNGDQDDLISIGTIGLIKGISTFKPDRNVRLATYASRCIENAILSMRLRKDEKEAGIIPRPLRRIGSVLYA